MNRDTVIFIGLMAEEVMNLSPNRAEDFLANLKAEIPGEMSEIADVAFRSGYATAKTDVLSILAALTSEEKEIH